MDIDEKSAIGIVAVVGGWLASFFYHGKRIGAMEEKFLQTVQRTDENEEAIHELKRVHDSDMASVRAFFTNSDGGQKFMTWPNHEAYCKRNSEDHAKDMRYMKDGIDRQLVQLDRQMAQFDILLSDISALKTDMAIVKERRKEQRTAGSQHQRKEID